MSRNVKLATALVSGTLLAASAGILTAVAVAQIGGGSPPTTTTTVSQSPGPPGEPGPPGPPGEPGSQSCPAGSTFTEVVWNHPGGHVTGWICVKDE